MEHEHICLNHYLCVVYNVVPRSSFISSPVGESRKRRSVSSQSTVVEHEKGCTRISLNKNLQDVFGHCPNH
jgi:hypothetical protein